MNELDIKEKLREKVLTKSQKNLAYELVEELKQYELQNYTPLINAAISDTVKRFNHREDVIANGIEFGFYFSDMELTVEIHLI